MITPLMPRAAHDDELIAIFVRHVKKTDHPDIAVMAHRLAVQASLGPDLKIAGTRDAVESLDAIKKHAKRLGASLDGLQIPAYADFFKALSGYEIDGTALSQTLQAVFSAADEAITQIRSVPYRRPPQRGRSKRPFRVTEVAAKAFEALTGREPTIITDGPRTCGPWVDFLTEVFSVLRIGSSAASRAKEYVAMKNRQAKAA